MIFVPNYSMFRCACVRALPTEPTEKDLKKENTHRLFIKYFILL